MDHGHRHNRVKDKSINMFEKIQGPKCVIISAGDLGDIVPGIADGDYCIACDAGLLYAEKLGITPDLIVGDFDSLGTAGSKAMDDLRQIKEQDPEKVLTLPVMKDDTDTMKAVKIGLSKGYKTFTFYGALGGRRFEHSFANIQTLLYLKHKGASAYILEKEKTLFIIENETIKFPKGTTGMLSVFSLVARSAGITLKGLKYNMENSVLTNDFPLGVSNEFLHDEEAEIAVREGTLLIILFRPVME